MILNLIIFHWMKNHMKTLYGAKSLHIIFDKEDGYIKKFDETDEIYDRIFNRVGCFTVLKSNMSEDYSHNYIKIKIDSDDDLPLEKILNISNVVIILTKSSFNKNYNLYYKAFLEKCSYI